MKRRLIFGLVFAMLIAGCSNKESEAKPAPAAAKPSPPAQPPAPEPAKEFADATKQRDYEKFFREYLAIFAAPENGSYLWLTLTDGGRVLGNVEKIEVTVDASDIYVKTAHHTAKLPAAYLVEESRARVFQADFARYHAMRRVNGEQMDTGTPVTRPFTRYALCDNIVPRVGPGAEYRQMDSTKFSRSSALTVCAESGVWIEVKADAKDSHQWIPRFMTYDMDELNLEARQHDLEILSKIGLVVRSSPEDNEVAVEPGMWSTMDVNSRPGIAQTMAAYCAAATKKSSVFLTVVDAETKTKLGKYSKSHGWEEATQ